MAPNISGRPGVHEIPAMFLFRDGAVVARTTRAMSTSKRKGRGSRSPPRDLTPEGRGEAAYSTLTLAISLPSASCVWMAQARHGSKEWMVRSASSGLSATAMGLPTREAS